MMDPLMGFHLRDLSQKENVAARTCRCSIDLSVCCNISCHLHVRCVRCVCDRSTLVDSDMEIHEEIMQERTERFCSIIFPMCNHEVVVNHADSSIVDYPIEQQWPPQRNIRNCTFEKFHPNTRVLQNFQVRKSLTQESANGFRIGFTSDPPYF